MKTLILLGSALLLLGCGDIENDWVGTWRVDSISGQTLEQYTLGRHDTIINLRDGTVKLETVYFVWTFNDDGTWIAVYKSILVPVAKAARGQSSATTELSGTYSLLSDSDFTLTLTRPFGGILKATQDGTWGRNGNELTLMIDDNDLVLVLKKAPTSENAINGHFS